MLPGFLKDSYKQYKDDTDRLATWLLSAAKKCGYEVPDLPPDPASAKKTKKSSSK
jgi:hypothetical protein